MFEVEILCYLCLLNQIRILQFCLLIQDFPFHIYQVLCYVRLMFRIIIYSDIQIQQHCYLVDLCFGIVVVHDVDLCLFDSSNAVKSVCSFNFCRFSKFSKFFKYCSSFSCFIRRICARYLRPTVAHRWWILLSLSL